MLWLQSALPLTGILLLVQRITAQQIPQQYHLMDGSRTWSDARSFCRVKYTDLATVNNMDDGRRLVDALGSRVTHTWIGLRRAGGDRWMWSDGSGTAHFTKWLDGEPNNSGGDEQCGEFDVTWNDVSCEVKSNFVCYERREDGKERFVYYSEKRSWVDSLELCRSKHHDLAYVRTEEANSEIANLARTWTGLLWLPNKVWMGLFRDNWMWSDGSDTSFRSWLKGSDHRGDCASVAVARQGHWVRAECDQRTSFVCQGGLKVKKTLVRMKLRSDVDLTESRISDTLLKKLETGLRLLSVTDFNLSWRRDDGGLVFHRQTQLVVAKATGC
ncbi:macrophage mannose receptor 1-like [Scophthalmus maximus]|uniref:macrophage mannose receptor 1-like n=1 Tax=Scophthalmus maximus TaxID=52904 RepID=UPI0015E0728D|nr:macrophage mannose receptor 1-like [Scophthalmus maximus]